MTTPVSLTRLSGPSPMVAASITVTERLQLGYLCISRGGQYLSFARQPERSQDVRANCVGLDTASLFRCATVRPGHMSRTAERQCDR